MEGILGCGLGGFGWLLSRLCSCGFPMIRILFGLLGLCSGLGFRALKPKLLMLEFRGDTRTLGGMHCQYIELQTIVPYVLNGHASSWGIRFGCRVSGFGFRV